MSGKYFISLSRTQPLPAHTRGVLCWYLTTFSNCTTCRTRALSDLVALSAPFGCISFHGWDLHLPGWWIPVCCSLPFYLYFHPSDQKDLSNPPPKSACRGWSRMNLKIRSFEGCCLQITNFQLFANCSFCSFLCLLHICVSTAFYDSDFLIHNSIVCKQDVKYEI